MRKIDKDGLILCDLQGRVFELSTTMTNSSSDIFTRRFMNSRIVKEFDNCSLLDTNLREADIIERIEEEYGSSDYGSIKYAKNEIFWIGYIYRYWSYTYCYSSQQLYRIVKPKELRSLFPAYHTLSPEQAIERIMEAKGLSDSIEADINRQYQIYRRIRHAVC